MWPVLTKGVWNRCYHFWDIGTVRQYTECSLIWYLNQARISNDRKVLASYSVGVKWRTQRLSFTSLPVARIDPSDFIPLLWERVTDLRQIIMISFVIILHRSSNVDFVIMVNTIVGRSVTVIVTFSFAAVIITLANTHHLHGPTIFLSIRNHSAKQSVLLKTYPGDLQVLSCSCCILHLCRETKSTLRNTLYCL